MGTCNCDGSSRQTNMQTATTDRLAALYPMVNEEETPLPRSWSPKDKYNYIGLSNGNLRVHYKGHGKTHKDAASVRAKYPIPASCGLYYFEVKIVSKGRDGYMGIGLSAQGVNMNRLPGWDKHSYGYHGDDGHSFCSSGTGVPYGPTFTTGDVIGCGVNLIDNTCFYTKNGHNLGIAFTDLPNNLYPTVGLQTPGEVIDANFGQDPFVYDVEEALKDLRKAVTGSIRSYTISESYGDPQAIVNRLVSSYLVHHGYCATAEAFASGTGQQFHEEITSIKNRQKILKLVLAGRMGEAIEVTTRLYPGLLENRPDLRFTLMCRQFIEMVNGSDCEAQPRSVINHTSMVQRNVTNGDSEDVEMDDKNGCINGFQNGFVEEEDVSPHYGKSRPAVDRMLDFGRELYNYSQTLFAQSDNNDKKKMLQDAFSLLAYSNPWASPVGWQLEPEQREAVCAALNSAILESADMAPSPPLEVAIQHAKELVDLMAQAGLGSCAFASVDENIGVVTRDSKQQNRGVRDPICDRSSPSRFKDIANETPLVDEEEDEDLEHNDEIYLNE